MSATTHLLEVQQHQELTQELAQILCWTLAMALGITWMLMTLLC